MRLDALLCPVSLSPNSRNILRAAGFLAQRSGARLRILHVVDPRLERAVAHLSAFEDLGLDVSAHRAAEYRFEEAVPLPLRSSIRWEAVLAEGDVGEQIAKAAEDPCVDLILMGFQQARLPGAVHWLDRVLRQARKPVLAVPTTVPAALAASWRHIILATDLGSGSEATQATARALAKMSGADLTVALVVEDLPPPVMGPEVLPVPDYRDFALKEAKRQLDQVFGPVWPEASRVVLRGSDPGREIARLAREEVADLIVVGYQADRPHLLGSVADRLLNQSVCAVLVVPHTGSVSLAGAA